MLWLTLPFLSQDINKRLSLPADLRVPDAFLQKTSISPEVPLSRASRRQSLSEIGFGRMETYTKLDKLGEVSLILLLPHNEVITVIMIKE